MVLHKVLPRAWSRKKSFRVHCPAKGPSAYMVLQKVLPRAWFCTRSFRVCIVLHGSTDATTRVHAWFHAGSYGILCIVLRMLVHRNQYCSRRGYVYCATKAGTLQPVLQPCSAYSGPPRTLRASAGEDSG
eukprot:CAMPEP_0181316558 /NCGR_PEP_ID=MMETSP1101-20121128/15960_1 /TAXON_ID=46948 /ORGANISM="Rhodomonas abbreviata, Strain Caron Lab Isolate" /LENGTH=129 /DNA_ID=CAMNT_0023423815 /DNA_START=120 /DNA_END=505 /DNA_ORIENTATION=+